MHPDNAPPVAVDDAATTTRATAVAIAVLANDTDADGDALSVTAVADPGHGTAAADAEGVVTYTPEAGYTGTDAFTYTVADGNGGSATGTVTVTVTEAGCAPTWAVALGVAPASGPAAALTIGQSADATGGLDAACGEAELPPPPPGFSAALVLPDGTTRSLADVRPDAGGPVWTCLLYTSDAADE